MLNTSRPAKHTNNNVRLFRLSSSSKPSSSRLQVASLVTPAYLFVSLESECELIPCFLLGKCSRSTSPKPEILVDASSYSPLCKAPKQYCTLVANRTGSLSSVARIYRKRQITSVQRATVATPPTPKAHRIVKRASKDENIW